MRYETGMKRNGNETGRGTKREVGKNGKILLLTLSVQSSPPHAERSVPQLVEMSR